MTVNAAFRDNRTLQLVAVMAESLLVGAYTVLIALVVWTIVYYPVTRPHKILFGASIIMFMLSVTHLGLVIQELSIIDIPLANGQAQVIVSVFQFILGDLILVWRVWIIWRRNYWIIIVPLAFMLAAAGTALNLLSASDAIQSFFTVVPVALIVSNTSLCTMLIAGKIWYISRSLGEGSAIHSRVLNNYRAVMALVIESGALYTASQITSLILNYTDSVAVPIMLDLEIPLIGILPTLIIVLVHYDMVPGGRSTKNCTKNSDKSGIDYSTMIKITREMISVKKPAFEESSVPATTLTNVSEVLHAV